MSRLRPWIGWIAFSSQRQPRVSQRPARPLMKKDMGGRGTPGNLLAGLGLVSYSCEATTRRQANGQLTRRRYRSQHRECHHSPTQLPTRAGRRATSGDLSREKLVLCRKRIHSLFAIRTRQTTRGSQESLLGGDGAWLTTTLDCILWSWPSTCICQQNKCLEGDLELFFYSGMAQNPRILSR